MEQLPQFDYTVVGAGPAGLAAASHIAKTGATVCVLDRAARPENVFGAYPVVVNARGMHGLERLSQDVAAKVEETGIPVTRMNIMPGNKIVAQVEAWGVGIMRDQTNEILLHHAEAQPNVTLFWQHKFVSLDCEKRTLTFERPDGSQATQKVQRLVAADGNRSRIRKACLEQLDDFGAVELPWGFRLRFMNGRAKEGATVDAGHHFVLGDRGYFCCQPDGRWSVSLRVLPGDADFLTGSEATPERIAELKAYVQEHGKLAAEELLTDADYASFYNYAPFDGLCVKLDRLNPLDWIAVIGDAAHAPMPATGEGINSSLEDAACLGECVAECPSDPFTLFDERHRADTHALHTIALAARELVLSPPPRQKAANVIVTIGLSIAKSLRIIRNTKYDFMLGAKARTQPRPTPYTDIVAMERRQTRGLRKFAMGVLKVLRVPNTNEPTEPQPESSEPRWKCF